MQWQHGSWVMNTTGSLILTPIAVDGRQLLSSPCQYKNSVYTRYNQSEVMAVSISIPEDRAEMVVGNRIWYGLLTGSCDVTVLRSLHRPLPQHPPPRPPQIRQIPHEPHVPRLLSPSNAPHHDLEPDHRVRNRGRQIHLKGEAQPRQRDPSLLETEVGWEGRWYGRRGSGASYQC